MESIENISDYHGIISVANNKINELVANKENESAKKLLKVAIIYAVTLYMDKKAEVSDPEILLKEVKKKITALDIDKLDVPEMYMIMSAYQAAADLKPTQHLRFKANQFERVMDEL